MRAANRMVGAQVLAAAFGAALAAQAPQPPSAPVTVRGRVTAAETGEGLPNARVSVSGTASATRADLDGRFTIVAPPTATLAVTKAGFVDQDQKLGADPRLRQAALDIRLTRSAAISGRVLDEHGDPVVGVTVFAAAAENLDKPSSAAWRSSTDDHGDYRISGLRPNAYTVSVQTAGAANGGAQVVTPISDRVVGNARVYSFQPVSYRTYFPDTLDPAMASSVTLGAGDERGDVDFHVPAARAASQSYSVIPGIVSLRDLNIPSDGTSTISGTILSRDGRPLPYAQVVLNNDTDMTFRVGAADEGGAYAFSGLPAGTYRVAASKPGFSLPSDAYTLTSYSRPGVVVTVGNRNRGRADVTLLPWAAISGHVFDEAGEPVAGARVGLLLTRYESGRRRLVNASTPQRVTDDRGEFRIYAIPNGDYVLVASVAVTPASNVGGYGPTFFPGTGAAAEARILTIAAGDESRGLDFSLVPSPTARVTGKLVDAAGQPTTGGRFTMVSRSALAARIDSRIGPDGAFEFANIPPGQYVIQADRGRLSGFTEGEFGAFPITVGGADITGLTLQTARGSTIKGRVVYQSINSSPPRPESITISAIPDDFDLAPPSLAVASPDADGGFQLVGITGWRRLEATKVPANWFVRAILVNGRDVTGELLEFGRANQSVDSVEIVLGDRPNQVGGSVSDDRGRRVTARVVVFSTERNRWYPASRFVRSVETGADGYFSVAGLPTGSYFVAAVVRTPQGDEAWRDPSFLDSIQPDAMSISIGEGESQIVNPRIGSR